MSNQYKIQIEPAPNQGSNSTPSNCDQITWTILSFELFKWNGSEWVKDNSDWETLQIEVGDEVTWVWIPGTGGNWPPNTSLAWLLMAQPGAQICTSSDDCSPLKSSQSLADYIDVTTGTLHQQQSLPTDCTCSSSNKTYVTPGSGDDSNTISISGSGTIASGNYLKLQYTIWFKTTNNNYSGSTGYWYYDPEIDVMPSGTPPNVQS